MSMGWLAEQRPLTAAADPLIGYERQIVRPARLIL
jgi:hypothetical protein